MTQWTALLYLFCRCLGATAALPLSSGLPAVGLRGSVGVALTIALLPYARGTDAFSIGTCLTEFICGFVVIIPLMLFMSLAGTLGEILDALRGQTIGNMYDPTLSGAVSLLHILLSNYQLALFFAAGGTEVLVGALARSCGVLPAGSLQGQSVAVLGERLVVMTAHAMSGVCSMALPFAVMCFLVEAGLGMTAKLGSGLNLSHEAFAIKIGIVFIMLGALQREGLGQAFTAVMHSFSLW